MYAMNALLASSKLIRMRIHAPTARRARPQPARVKSPRQRADLLIVRWASTLLVTRVPIALQAVTRMRLASWRALAVLLGDTA
jgi:hypothetical protein